MGLFVFQFAGQGLPQVVTGQLEFHLGHPAGAVLAEQAPPWGIILDQGAVSTARLSPLPVLPAWPCQRRYPTLCVTEQQVLAGAA